MAPRRDSIELAVRLDKNEQPMRRYSRASSPRPRPDQFRVQTKLGRPFFGHVSPLPLQLTVACFQLLSSRRPRARPLPGRDQARLRCEAGCKPSMPSYVSDTIADAFRNSSTASSGICSFNVFVVQSAEWCSPQSVARRGGLCSHEYPAKGSFSSAG